MEGGRWAGPCPEGAKLKLTESDRAIVEETAKFFGRKAEQATHPQLRRALLEGRHDWIRVHELAVRTRPE